MCFEHSTEQLVWLCSDVMSTIPKSLFSHRLLAEDVRPMTIATRQKLPLQHIGQGRRESEMRHIQSCW